MVLHKLICSITNSTSINQFDFLKNTPTNDRLNPLAKATMEAMGSIYGVVLLAGIVISVLAFMVTGVVLLIKKKREETKSKIYGLIVAICVLCGATSIVSIGIAIGMAW